MYKSSGSWFFGTTAGIKSGTDAYDKSRFVMTLTTVGVTEILCSFRLVLEGKIVPELSRLKFLEKFFTNSFALSDPEDNTSGLLNRGGIANLPLLRTLLAICQKSLEPSFWEVMDSFVLLANASLASSRTVFLTNIWLPYDQLWAIIEGGSLTHLMLITPFLCIRPKGHWEPVARLPL